MENTTRYPVQVKVDPQVVDQVFNDIFMEIYKAGKIPEWRQMRDLLRVFLRKPVGNFSRFIARVDALIRDFGFVQAGKIAIEELAGGMQSVGGETIPREGPVVVASNHPGTYDGFALIANLQREDFKIMVSGIPFFRNLPHASRYLIYSTHDVNDRMQAIRQSIRHLSEGRLVIIYPSGRIDPDPAVLPGAAEALSLWSRSIEVFLRKVPQASLVLAITSGVLSPEFVHHPYPRLFRNDHERRRVTEFMQVIKQMVQGKPVSVDPCISFAKPMQFRGSERSDLDALRDQIQTNALDLLHSHISAFSLPKY